MEVKMKDITPIDKSSLLNDACNIIEQAQKMAYNVVNETLIKRNWLLGMRIQKEILNGQRAEYGELIVKTLAKSLTMQYGEGFTKTNLYNYIGFFQKWPDFFHAVSGISEGDKNIFHAVSGKSEIVPTSTGQSEDFEIVNAMSSQSSVADIMQSLAAKYPIMLSWTHYRIILQENSKDARDWYEREATKEMWSTRTLQRNISSQYYHRMLMSQHKELVHEEMIEKTSPLQDKLEFIKNPVIAEFLGFPQEATFTESELETSIINNLQKFIMELGKGYAFVARQQHIHTEKEDYYIDLVFYNYLLKSFVLIDLKTTKVTHQDVGQMDMYVRMYDELKRGENDNPTIGILICADTDEDIARYSVLYDSDQLFAAKYKTYMPTDEELRAEIEAQKNIYYLQHKEK